MTATLDSLRFPLKGTVSANDMERLLAEASHPDVKHVSLDVRGIKNDSAVGAARAVGVLAELRRRSIPVEVVLDLGGSDRTVRDSRFQSFFVDQAFGFTLGSFATDIRTVQGQSVRKEVADLQRVALDENEGVIGKGDQIAMPMLDTFPWPTRAALVNADTVSDFAAQLRTAVRRLGLPPLPALSSIADFAWETLENGAQHATTDNNGQKVNGLRMILIRRIGIRGAEKERLADLGAGPGQRFIDDLYRRESADFLAKQVLVEVTVVDSGIGIPARLSGDDDIYDGPHDEEVRYVNRAVEAKTTSKVVNDPDVGLGLWKAMHACFELSGVAVVRTGRTTVGRDYTGDERRWPDPELYAVHDVQHRIAGTAWTLVVPWWERGLF